MRAWFARRGCRKVGHQWRHKTVPTDMCNATYSTCVRCGYATWRYWEDDRV